ARPPLRPVDIELAQLRAVGASGIAACGEDADGGHDPSRRFPDPEAPIPPREGGRDAPELRHLAVDVQDAAGILRPAGADQRDQPIGIGVACFANRHAHSSTSVPRPRKARKPITSVTMVTKIEAAIAGSILSRSSATGITTPMNPAATMLMIIAIAITAPIIQSWNHRIVTSPTK